MNFIKTVLVRVIAVILFVLVIVASSENSDPAALVFLDWHSGEWPLSILLLASFSLGVGCTILYNLWANTRLRLAARRANKNTSQAERNLDKIRAERAPENMPMTAQENDS